jgi:hypothetical protein
MRLVREARIRDLLPAGTPGRLEASGVVTTGGHYLVIFDNLRAVALIDTDLDRVAANMLVPTAPGRSAGYEDIARDPVTGHYFLLIESEARDGGYQARVEEYDDRLRFVSASWLEYPLARPNKGIEGLEVVRRDGEVHLLGLHETGGLLVFRNGRRNWRHVATVDLPATLDLADYSAVTLAGGRLALVSQEDSALWAGDLADDKWATTGPGRTHPFPRGPAGYLLYRTIEGVCGLGPDRVVAVSDRGKRTTNRSEEESLHIFDL